MHSKWIVGAVALLAIAIVIIVRMGSRLLPMRAAPDTLLITLDTTRADHLGAYGDRRARTPRLDRLANEGVLFERALAAAPITLPAHASLFTGLYPFAHGVRNNGNFSLNASAPTLATALHDGGYLTAAFVSAFVLDRRYGLARGFDEYDDRLGDSAPTQPARRGLERRATAGRCSCGCTSPHRDLLLAARRRGPRAGRRRGGAGHRPARLGCACAAWRPTRGSRTDRRGASGAARRRRDRSGQPAASSGAPPRAHHGAGVRPGRG